MYIYTYNVYVLCEWFKGSCRKKGGEKEETSQSRPSPPRGVSSSAAIVVCSPFSWLWRCGPGFPWTLGAACGRVEPEPPALPSLKQQRR